jgi:ATP-dependent RNA helicase RhlE
MITFDALGLKPPLLRALAGMGFQEPTPVQAAAIPPALQGRDILGSASTGSGKSAAFGLPILQMLAEKPTGKTRCLILAPTRELAAQTAAHLAALGAHLPIKIAAVYGGVGFGPQTTAFRRGTDIIVATPGRLLDLLGQGTASLKNISMLVVDEADRMFDMGFLPSVRRILKQIPTDRQTMFFSATMPPDIIALTREMLRDPVRVDLQPKVAPAAGITQTAYAIDQQRKGLLLVELLRDQTIYNAIAFTRTKSRANRLATLLDQHKIPAERIHGDLSQAKRTRVLADFKRGKYRVLVATDIAARGIDIVDLGHVVNFDVPNVPEDYVHRIGRTARAEAKGDAITFVSAEEEKLFGQIERSLGTRVNRTKCPILPAQTPTSPGAFPFDVRSSRGRQQSRRPARAAR